MSSCAKRDDLFDTFGSTYKQQETRVTQTGATITKEQHDYATQIYSKKV